MSIVTMVLGESGTGKTTSLRNMEAAETLLIQAVKKPLPFKSKAWKRFDKEVCKEGNIFQTDSAAQIINIMQKTKRKVIVLDDFQYVMANEFMRRTNETGFNKFTEIGKNAWDIINAAAALPEDVRVYILSHIETSESGHTKIKTIGRMLDEKIALEGMVTIVLRTQLRDGQYLFATRNNGSDTTKTPMGLFDAETIDNDLRAVDQAIQEYYELTEQPA
ncbi:AAA family ATPase [Pusillimonas noertemannii]|uniref:AAA domain-containing protein n=1 Tax=Pusillimonas noertemannii TaxID=305977 RepID=A0A2U1CRT8_9BURK|nr:AAA family ATPase [Pusillimonas noertemannii]NYT67935.1 AAA family ATPase [Pusillimonas noertemannii]PVY68606.1 AAA domain-containing protein [Pusillimonas noertemannii]TFL11922.1 ATP-binding protein [Pusillimonas noertemannii]